MKNVKTLTATILLGMGLLMGGCGTNTQTATQAQQTQEVQQNEGISLMKAIDLASKGQFTPQKVKTECSIQNKVFGDEPYITGVAFVRMEGDTRVVHVKITDPQIIKNVANWQEKHKKVYGKGDVTVDAHTITFGQYGNIEVE